MTDTLLLGVYKYYFDSRPMKSCKGNVLLASYESCLLDSSRHRMESEHYKVFPASTLSEFLDLYSTNAPDIIVYHIRTGGSDETDFKILAEIKEKTPHLPVVALDGGYTMENAIIAESIDLDHLFTLPISFQDLSNTMDRLVRNYNEKRNIVQENRQKKLLLLGYDNKVLADLDAELKKEGYDVLTSNYMHEAFDLHKGERIKGVVCDAREENIEKGGDAAVKSSNKHNSSIILISDDGYFYYSRFGSTFKIDSPDVKTAIKRVFPIQKLV
ncbi:MAG: hypothetical protein NT120_03285 [Candidatus Aenigmarchaeota archaeon]|nr:hypothetical protein [Candidatus Aenigmarchaeota archaeon]